MPPPWLWHGLVTARRQVPANSLGHGHLPSSERQGQSLCQRWEATLGLDIATTVHLQQGLRTWGQHHLGCATSQRCPSPCSLPLASSLLWLPACRLGATLRSLQHGKEKAFQLHTQLTPAARYHPAPSAMGESHPVPATSSTDLQPMDPREDVLVLSPAAAALSNQCYRRATPACGGRGGSAQLLGGTLQGQEVGTGVSLWGTEQEGGGEPRECKGGDHLLGPTGFPGCLLHYSAATSTSPLGRQGSGDWVSVLRN